MLETMEISLLIHKLTNVAESISRSQTAINHCGMGHPAIMAPGFCAVMFDLLLYGVHYFHVLLHMYFWHLYAVESL